MRAETNQASRRSHRQPHAQLSSLVLRPSMCNGSTECMSMCMAVSSMRRPDGMTRLLTAQTRSPLGHMPHSTSLSADSSSLRPDHRCAEANQVLTCSRSARHTCSMQHICVISKVRRTACGVTIATRFVVTIKDARQLPLQLHTLPPSEPQTRCGTLPPSAGIVIERPGPACAAYANVITNLVSLVGHLAIHATITPHSVCAYSAI